MLLFEQMFGGPPQGVGNKKFEENDMSAVTYSSIAPHSGIYLGFSQSEWLANPSGAQSESRLTRRGRLARTLFVLSLTVVMAAGFAARSGAGSHVDIGPSYVIVVVPVGASLWSVASAYSDGDVAAMVETIRETNNLPSYDVAAGARLRVPVK